MGFGGVLDGFWMGFGWVGRGFGEVLKGFSMVNDASGAVWRSVEYGFLREFSGVFAMRSSVIGEFGPRGGACARPRTSVSARGCAAAAPQQASGAFTKTSHDLMGRAVATYLGSHEGASTDPNTTTNDIIVEQTKYLHDTAGRVWLTTHCQRRHDDATTAVELTYANSRATYAAGWFDGLGRTVKTVNYGTNGGVLLDEKNDDFNPGVSGVQNYTYCAGGMDPNSAASDLCIITKTDYDGFGRAWKTTDNAGKATTRSRPNHGLAQWFQPRNTTADQFRDYRTRWDPSAHLPYAKMPMPWVNSFSDGVFPVDAFSKSVQAAGGPSTLCLRPWLIHGHGYGWDEAWEIYNFADSVVKGGAPLPSLARPQVGLKDGLVHAKYKGDVKSAWVYFTTPGGRWQSRRWGKMPCNVGKDELISQQSVPGDTKAVNVNACDKRDDLVSSEVIVVKPQEVLPDTIAVHEG